MIVDDNTFIRELISSALDRNTERYEVIAQRATAAAAIEACTSLRPDVVVLEIDLPDQSGIQTVPELKQVSPSTRILLCTAAGSDDRLVRSIRSGAEGFIEKRHTLDEFLHAVHVVGSGERFFCSRAPARAASRSAGGRPIVNNCLSKRETEVLRLIATGRSTKEIARDLGLSAPTIGTHRANLLAKLGVHNVAGLVTYAFEAGLVELHERGSEPSGAIRRGSGAPDEHSPARGSRTASPQGSAARGNPARRASRRRNGSRQ